MAQYKWFHITVGVNIDDIKAEYRRLVLKNHPDLGGSDEAMAEINVEFQELSRKYGHLHKAANGSIYEKETDERPTDFIEIIDALIKMGLTFEIVGTFVWVSGNTYDHKDELKARGFKWSSKRKMWYLAPNGWKRRRGSNLSMDEIRDLYGVRYSHSSEDNVGLVVA